MKNTYITIILLLTACTKPEHTKLVMHRELVETKDESGWFIAESTEGKFSITLPIPFNDFTVISTEPNGEEIETFAVGAKHIDGLKFTATEAQLKGDVHFPDFNQLTSELKEKGTKIHESSEGEYDSMPCITIHSSNEKYGAFYRYILGSDSLFILILEYPLTKSENIELYRDQFFSTFKIKSAEQGTSHNEHEPAPRELDVN